MREYTFAMVTYNQEQFVLEHLESIRYQIENYGKNYSFFFLLCDDCSIDKTVLIVKKWIDKNSYLFAKTKFVISKKNKGIVNNYLQCLRNIETNEFKILAGDDLYYKNNIFKYTQNRDVVLSPVISIPSINIEEKFYWTYKFAVLKERDLRKNFEKLIKYVHPVQTPGVFWKKKFYSVELEKKLEQYIWIEDTPLWEYLFSIKSLKVYFEKSPLVMYRESVGISNNSKHAFFKAFREEQIRIDKCIHIYKRCSMVNPYKYKYFIMKILYGYIVPHFSNRYRQLVKMYNNEKAEAVEYFNLIKKRGADNVDVLKQ